MNTAINFDTISLGDKICDGSFGEIFKGKWLNKDVAIKVYKNLNIEREYRQLSRANHNNIIFVHGLSMNASTAYLVMEYVDGGSLYNFLHTENTDYKLDHVINWSSQISNAIAYLHDMKPTAVIHRNLKSSNILLTDRRRTVKISDFFHARRMASSMTCKIGTIAYMAPEVFACEKYTEKCDIYSFSIILWEMLAQDIPYKTYKDKTLIEVMEKVQNGERPSLDNLKLNCPDNILELLKKCWKGDPMERSSMEDIIDVLREYPFDFEKLSLPVNL